METRFNIGEQVRLREKGYSEILEGIVLEININRERDISYLVEYKSQIDSENDTKSWVWYSEEYLI